MRYADTARAESVAYWALIKYCEGNLPINVRRAVSACRRARVMTYDEAVAALDMDREEFSRLALSDEVFVLRREFDTGAEFLLLTSAKRETGRERFSLAHELGHMLLGHGSSERACEIEANVFAAAFLCPRPILRATGLTRARDVAAAFGISLEAAAIALNAVHMPDRASAAVCDALTERFGVRGRNGIEDYMTLASLANYYAARMGKRNRPSAPPKARENRVASALDDMERLMEIRMDSLIY